MVWFRVCVLEFWFGFGFDLGFCVMTWFNGMVEFLQMVVLGNCNRINAWLPTYPLDRRIRSPL